MKGEKMSPDNKKRIKELKKSIKDLLEPLKKIDEEINREMPDGELIKVLEGWQETLYEMKFTLHKVDELSELVTSLLRHAR